jgi:hypothetical protein
MIRKIVHLFIHGSRIILYNPMKVLLAVKVILTVAKRTAVFATE